MQIHEATKTELDKADPRKLTIKDEIRKLVPPLTDAERTALTDDIKSKGTILTPILIDQNGNVLDGHNRVEIAVELEMEEIPVTVVTVEDEDDAKRIAIEANLNRRHLTLQSRKKIARQLVKLTPWKSNRQLAVAAGLDPKTVGSIRDELEGSGEVPEQDTTIGADNKARPSKARKTSAEPTSEKAKQEQFSKDIAALKTGVEEILGKLGRKQIPALSPEAFVAALKPAQKKAKWLTEGVPQVVSFWEEVQHLLENEAAAQADAESKTVSAPEPGAAPPSDSDAPF